MVGAAALGVRGASHAEDSGSSERGEVQVGEVWSLLKPLQQAGGQVWEEPGEGLEVGGGVSPARQAAGSRQGC